MKAMVIVKAMKSSEAGLLPSEALLAEIRRYNEALVGAGVMLAREGLQPSSVGKRLRFSSGKTTVLDGPFAETQELVAGFWIWQAKSREEAVEWARRCPDCMPGEASELEFRPIYEAEDLGQEFTPELRAQEERLHAEIGRQRRSMIVARTRIFPHLWYARERRRPPRSTPLFSPTPGSIASRRC